MQQKVQHTFLWLKVMPVAYVAELLFFFAYPGIGVSYWLNEFTYLLIFAATLIGLLIGLLLNLVTKFRRPVLTYVIGHVLLVICAVLSESGSTESFSTGEKGYAESEVATGNVTISGDSKQAIEQVIYKMEELYPFGVYDIISIDDRYVDDDSTGNSGTNCTIVFSLKEEDGNKYISKYLVKDDSLQAVFIKKDTNSAEYREYITTRQTL